MGFFDDLLSSGEDFLTSTFDPKYGWLGRPVSGAARSALDIGASMDPMRYLERIGADLGVPGAKSLEESRIQREAELSRILDETIGAGLGRKMVGEPVQEMAESALGVDFGREVPTGELFKSAVLPEMLPGDVAPVSKPSMDFPLGTPRTSEDVKDVIEARHQVGGGVESVGNLIEMAPELLAIPAAPGLGMAFIPGIAESLGTNLGTGEYGKAAIDALFAGSLAKHTGGLTRGAKGTSEARMEEVTDLEAPLPPPDLTAGKEILAKRGLSEQQFLDDPRHALAETFVNDIRNYAANLTNNPRLRDAKIEPDFETSTARFDPKTSTIRYNPDFMFQNPREASNTILHELSHGKYIHGIKDIGIIPEGQSGEPTGIVRTGGETIAEVPIEDRVHTTAAMGRRAKYSPQEYGRTSDENVLQQDPKIWEARERFEKGLEKTVPDDQMLGMRPIPSEPVSEFDLSAPEKEKVVSEPANILRKILQETKLTKFNKDTLVEGLKAKGIEVPEEVKVQIPELLSELKDRGWVNEKVGGTYTLLVEPPKRIQEIAKGKGPSEEVIDIEAKLRESLEAGKKETRTWGKSAISSKPPSLEQQMKEKLTPDEIRAIGKLFGGETKRPGTKEIPEEVRQAQQAALRAGGKKPKVKEPPPEAIGEVGGEAEGPKKTYDVTLSDGSTHKVQATSPEEAKTKAESVLEEHKSTKTVDKVEEHLGTLERAAKYEIEPVKEGAEAVSEEVKDIRAAKAEEVKGEKKLGAEEEKLRRAQTKEKFQKKAWTVLLSTGKEITVKARSEKAAKEYVENKIRAKKSKVTVSSISEKLSPLEKELAGGKGPPKEPPKFGRESITPEDSFSQAWRKLTPTEKVTEVWGIIKAMRSSGDLGHLLRQGKLMTVDFLTTGNAKELGSALRTMKEATFSEKKFDEINEASAKDPLISKLVTDFGLDLPGIAGHLKEEAFHAGTAEKIPGVGKYLIKPSERAYTSFLNEARKSEAKRLVKIGEDAGFSLENDPEVFKSLMKAVNIVSSRGDFKKIGPTLNNLSNVLWAPRLKLSRMQLLSSALGGGEMHPLARAELRKSLGRTVAVNMALLGLAGLAGANIETDPRNSDWGKIKIKNTRIDPWFGLQPIVRSVLLMYYGERISSTTGTKRKVTVPEVLGQQITSGVAPGPAYTYEMLRGQSVSGFPIDRSERALLGVSPMIAEDIYEAFKQYGLIGGFAAFPPSILGEGIHTYEEKGKVTNRPKGRKYPHRGD